MDVYKIAGIVRYGSGQAQDGVMNDIWEIVDAVVKEKFPRLKYELRRCSEPTMPALELSKDSRMVQALNNPA